MFCSAAFFSVKTIVAAWTASEKVAVIVEVVATPVAPAVGDIDVTVGGVVSGATVVNVHVVGVGIALLLRSVAETEAVNVMPPASAAVGVKVAVLVPEL